MLEVDRPVEPFEVLVFAEKCGFRFRILDIVVGSDVGNCELGIALL